MSKFITLAVGTAEVVAGGILAMTGVGAAIAPWLIMAGAGTIMSGIGTLLSHRGAMGGFATTVRNPTAPWKVVYGRARTGGTVVYMHSWGDSAKMLDLVIVLAAHSCQSVDVVLFDQQRVQIDTNAAPAGAAAGSGTSFTPVQQTVNISRIQRVDGVVTVTLPANIPYLIEGDRVQVTDVPGDLTLNGTVQVAQILSRTVGSPGNIKFTFLSGGIDSDVSSAGHVKTLWADYGRKVYFEPLLGGQTLGQTFKGMAGTPYDGDMHNIVNPNLTSGLGGGGANHDEPNPWTGNCSLQGKTAVFIRLHYNDQYFRGGLPQISFLMHGKNDIQDTRTSPPTVGYTENAALCIADFLAHPTWGFKAVYGTEIPTAELNAAANVCDESVPLALSTASPPMTEPAYTCNGQFDISMRPGEILQNLLTSCAGRLTYVGGKFVIWPAAWRGNSFAIGSNPGGGVTALGDFALLAAGAIRWRPTVSGRDLYNGVKGTYISQANKWMASDFPPYAQDALHGYASSPTVPENDANMARDGGVRRWKDVQFPFTISAATAQRLAKIELMRCRQQGTGTLVFNLAAYTIAPMDCGLVTIPFLNWTAKQLEVLASRFRLEQGGSENSAAPVLLVEVDVQETAASVYDWSTEEELSPQGYVQPEIPGIGGFGFFPTEIVPGHNAPFPWTPGHVAPLGGDAYWTGPIVGSPPTNRARASFGMQVVYGTTREGNPTANLNVEGSLPPNALASINPPQISCVLGGAGRLPAGRYVIAASAFDTSTPMRNSRLSVPVVVTIPESSPPGVNNGSIAVTVNWPADSDGGEIYCADVSDAAGYHFQRELSSAETAYTITDFDQSTSGAPDGTFDHLAVAWTKVVHAGCFAAQVQAVTADTVTLGGSGMTTDQWAGYVLSLLGKLDSTEELIILNMPIASSTASVDATSPPGSPPTGDAWLFTLTIGPNAAADQLPDLRTLLVVGDLLAMNYKTVFGEASVSDANIANPFYPDGATGVEPGHLALVLMGPAAGTFGTVESVSVDGDGKYTIFNLASPWAIQPNDGDQVVIVEAGFGPEEHTQSFWSPNRTAVSGVAATPQVTNLAGQTWLVLVRSQTVDSVNGLDRWVPMRPIYIFGSQGTRTIAESGVQEATDRIIIADAAAGNIVYTLLPFAEIPNRVFFFQKVDATENTVTILCGEGDTINGSPKFVLAKQEDRLYLVIPA